MAGRLDIRCRQGSRFTRTVTYTDSAGSAIDMSGWDLRMQARTVPDSTDTVLDISDGGGLTYIDAAAGEFEIDVSAVTMADVPAGTYWYDLECVPGGDETFAFALLAGRLVVAAEVTR